jgi:long-chain acyl-CoA synthetase
MRSKGRADGASAFANLGSDRMNHGYNHPSTTSAYNDFVQCLRDHDANQMPLQNLNDILLSVAKSDRDRVMLQKRASGWVPISSAQIYRSVVGVSRALESWGIHKGDRVAILSENRPEWTIADFAILSLGAVTVPVYATQTAVQTAYLLNDSGVRVVVVSSKSQLEKILTIHGSAPMERIIVMDAIETPHAVRMQDLMLQGPPSSDSEFEARARSVRPEDLATIIYTSGTTGTPKGAMLTHGNMASNIVCSMEAFGFGTKDELSVSFLPLSHVTARHVDFALLYRGVVLAYCPDISQLAKVLAEVQPNIFIGVPRVYEKIRQQVIAKITEFPDSAVYRWALSVGRAHRAETVAGKQPTTLSWKIADRLVFSRVRLGMGGKAEEFISGGAPLGRELAEWYADIGIPIHEGYGLTETSPVIAVNTPNANRLGTVGKPLGNVEVKIAEDGEVLARGPSIFKGYWNRPADTEAVFVDGWFKTGDIGALDRDGYLSITDRKKDLIKTSGGKFIAPQPIENSLKLNPFVGTSVVLGDRRKFPAVLIAPHYPVLEDWARAHQINFASREALVANAKVQALYEGIVEELNQNLARFERLKRVLLVPEELSEADGTLTHTLKVRRRGIEDRYRKLIDDMYAKVDVAGS